MRLFDGFLHIVHIGKCDFLSGFSFLVVRQLSHCLKRRTSVNHLYQAASLVISPTNANSYQILQTVITVYIIIHYDELIDEF